MRESKIELSDEHREILKLLAKGLNGAAIAYIMHISYNTVKYHKKRIFMMLGVHSVCEAVAIAIEDGIISDD
jgi:LuxR family maltose regulon positive regulatory protein